MTGRVAVVAVGARTPLGPSAPSSWLALRAGLSGIREHRQMVDGNGDRIVGGWDPDLNPASRGAERLAALLDLAFRDLRMSLPAGVNGPLALPLLLNLPEPRPGFSATDAGRLRDGLARLDLGPLAPDRVHIRTSGHAGGLEALGVAHAAIQRGETDAVLIAGAESYFDADTIDWLEAHRQLLNATGRSAFAPAEGAAVCLATSEALARSMGFPARMPVLSVSRAVEPVPIKAEDGVCLGRGLSEALGHILRALHGSDRINAIVSDQNGERYRSDEWGFMAIRDGRRFDNVTDYLAPATGWGDMGAATGPLFVALAFLNGSQDPKPRTLLAASSESGLRAMALVGPTERGG
ncbi:hypothetical protein [Rubellimicrobium arenae]|uniref:hypothetical protein n=1 Tax=Rubellimicrobium arenae TaxID=2817372 RepID=UPI001B304A39|nr:hypothetical protein [Rubellimicrobium arenae]